MTKPRVLVVDDEDGIRFAVSSFLEAQGWAVEQSASCEEARRQVRANRPDVVVLDYRLPDGDALALMPSLADSGAAIPTVILTGHGSIDLAVRAIKAGAQQFLTKPVELPSLHVLLEKMLESARETQRAVTRRARRKKRRYDPFVGGSDAIRHLEDRAHRVAASDHPVLILGETGSGKGVLARWIHDHGPRADNGYVDLNCAGLSSDLLSSELFGHRKGSFTGAHENRMGLLEAAHRGTVFLDEIGDMDPRIQPTLLKVLEDKQFRRVGEVRDRRVDIRLITATHHDLRSEVEAGRFRGDLYYRISTVPLALVPLRERPEDVPRLVEEILTRIGGDVGRSETRLTTEALDALVSYSWPGNIRELRNVLERALLLTDHNDIDRADLSFEDPSFGARDDATTTLQAMEKQHIERILHLESGSVARAATTLDIPKSTLYLRIKQYGIEVKKA